MLSLLLASNLADSVSFSEKTSKPVLKFKVLHTVSGLTLDTLTIQIHAGNNDCHPPRTLRKLFTHWAIINRTFEAKHIRFVTNGYHFAAHTLWVDQCARFRVCFATVVTCESLSWF